MSWEVEVEPVRLDAASAFEQELVPLLRPAYRLALGMTLDPGLAEDAVQDAVLRAWRKRDTRRRDTPLRPWLLAIVANRCRDLQRNHWARIVLLDALPERVEPIADTSQSLAVRRAIAALPRKDRQAVILRYYLDLPYDEVARTLGCSVNAAKLRTARAIVRLRRSLVEAGVQ